MEADKGFVYGVERCKCDVEKWFLNGAHWRIGILPAFAVLGEEYIMICSRVHASMSEA